MHPDNRNIRPKIRQQLQGLVTQGLIEWLEPGTYRRAADRVNLENPDSRGPQRGPSVA
jgi:Dam-replacing HTH domain